MCLGLATGYREPTENKERTYADLKQTHFPENKIDTELTRDDVLKAWECCKPENDEGCLNCPLNNVPLPECAEILSKESVDLINRQQAKIEGLDKDYTRVCAERDARIVTNSFIKSEAIKEFAERLKEKKFELDDQNEDIFNAVEVADIDNLVKEMVGE